MLNIFILPFIAFILYSIIILNTNIDKISMSPTSSLLFYKTDKIIDMSINNIVIGSTVSVLLSLEIFRKNNIISVGKVIIVLVWIITYCFTLKIGHNKVVVQYLVLSNIREISLTSTMFCFLYVCNSDKKKDKHIIICHLLTFIALSIFGGSYYRYNYILASAIIMIIAMVCFLMFFLRPAIKALSIKALSISHRSMIGIISEMMTMAEFKEVVSSSCGIALTIFYVFMIILMFCMYCDKTSIPYYYIISSWGYFNMILRMLFLLLPMSLSEFAGIRRSKNLEDKVYYYQ